MRPTVVCGSTCEWICKDHLHADACCKSICKSGQMSICKSRFFVFLISEFANDHLQQMVVANPFAVSFCMGLPGQKPSRIGYQMTDPICICASVSPLSPFGVPAEPIQNVIEIRVLFSDPHLQKVFRRSANAFQKVFGNSANGFRGGCRWFSNGFQKVSEIMQMVFRWFSNGFQKLFRRFFCWRCAFSLQKVQIQ